ncbi:hypothetical protein PV327_008259 [Microctonus hyperodae]|uniref:Mitochondrial import inner membrane translocase subunit TIM50 n=1 Tax=Microctonus hyperodae TaxID=165561 RepID=A0AA39F2R3_MICHY|nr:hypothetical protein PV327_008259 [Microctonus hyperodae]
MAFALRSLRIFCRNIHNGNGNGALLSLRKSNTKLNLIRITERYKSTIEDSVPKIAGSLTNISVTSSSIPSLQQNLNEKKEQNESNTNNEDEEDRKQREQSWKMMKISFIIFGVSLGAMGGMFIYDISRPVYDENGDLVEDEFSHLPFFQQLWKRLYRELTYYKKLVQEPSREKLLPDPLKYPYIQPPYTLVLEMTDVLVHPDWTYQTGWRFKKRPGVDQFLEALAPPQFEIVIYTAESGMSAFPILDSLDPNGYIMYRLVRDATRFVDGHHVKDLDAINRDLKKVIVVDWNANSVKFHPDNALKLPRWNGNDDDTTLYDLAAFLKTIHATSVDDVRDVLSYYRQFDNPLEVFRENQRKLLLQMQEDESQKEQQSNSKPLTSKWSKTFFR